MLFIYKTHGRIERPVGLSTFHPIPWFVREENRVQGRLQRRLRYRSPRPQLSLPSGRNSPFCIIEMQRPWPPRQSPSHHPSDWQGLQHEASFQYLVLWHRRDCRLPTGEQGIRASLLEMWLTTLSMSIGDSFPRGHDRPSVTCA